ncbi:MAG TPA: histidine phosphatase family protein [Nakamurella sp.]
MSSAPSRTLVLLRHGKSAYPPGVPDHARPLADRGHREAALAGEHIRARVDRFDLVLCSTSERTRQTLARAGLAAGAEVRYPDELYGAEYDEILDQIAAVPASVTTLLVVGHFPGIAEVAEDLAGPGSDGAALAGIERKFPTSAFAVVTVTGPWSALPANSRLEAFTVPRDHPTPEPATEES